MSARRVGGRAVAPSGAAALLGAVLHAACAGIDVPAELANVRTQIEQVRRDQEALRRAFESGRGAGPPAVESITAGEAARDASSGLFREAYSMFHTGRFVEAEAGFAVFLETSADGSLADDAMYWIGACRLARGRVQEAISEWRALIERHPGEDRVPDALYRIALALGSPEGVPLLHRIVREFPDSDAAILARGHLASR